MRQSHRQRLRQTENSFLGQCRERGIRSVVDQLDDPEQLIARHIENRRHQHLLRAIAGAAIDFLFARGAQDVTAICILAAPEGLAKIEELVGDRDVTLVLGSLDERLNDKGYIVPGLGDAGDRLYGTV